MLGLEGKNLKLLLSYPFPGFNFMRFYDLHILQISKSGANDLPAFVSNIHWYGTKGSSRRIALVNEKLIKTHIMITMFVTD